MKLPQVYIAGPYTRPDPVANSRRAVDVMHAMLDTGAVTPLCPHLSLLADFARSRPVEEWYAYDLRLLERCDALYLLRGASTGADAEVAFARERSIPVFPEQRNMADLLAWANRWRPPADARRAELARVTGLLNKALPIVQYASEEMCAEAPNDGACGGRCWPCEARAFLAANGGAS